MRVVIVSFFMLLFFVNGFSQGKKEHFRGGMMLHAGYLSNNAGEAEVSGFCSGIGGKIVFPLGHRIRIGTEGYVSNYTHKESDGFYKLGWGGLLAEYVIAKSKLQPVLGITVGGGRVRDLYPLLGDYHDNNPDLVIYKDYSSMIVAPQFSLEYPVTDHINLAVKADYLFYPGNDFSTYIARGPRFYFGVLFSR